MNLVQYDKIIFGNPYLTVETITAYADVLAYGVLEFAGADKCSKSKSTD